MILPKIQVDRIGEALAQGNSENHPGWPDILERMGPLTPVSQAGHKYDQMNARQWATLIHDSINPRTGEWSAPDFEIQLIKFFTPERMDKFSTDEQTVLLQLFPLGRQTEWQDSLPKAKFVGPIGQSKIQGYPGQKKQGSSTNSGQRPRLVKQKN